MMLSKMKFQFFPLVLILLYSGLSHAANENGYDYPELSVVPRATEQVLAESIRNRDSAWKKHLPLLVPASATFIAGAMELAGGTKADENTTPNSNASAKVFPWVAMGVGAAWWATVLGLVDPIDYHSEAVEELNNLPAKTTREQLLRERRAEEAISKAGSLAKKLKWISFGSNLIAGALVAASSKSETAGVYFGAGAALLSITPILFPHRWESLDCLQKDYKKRIYAPVAGITFLKSPVASAALSPGLSLSLEF
jgi:hypothetical protein